MTNWKETTWGELATLEYGKALRDYKDAEGPYRVYGTNGSIGWHTEFLYDQPSVIIGRKGAYRGVHYSENPFYVIDTAFYLKPKTGFDIKWAYYQLLTQDINGMDSGSAIPSTSRDSFYQLPVLLPSPKEQKRIAGILGSLDDKIELNRRTNETLEAIPRAIFQSWFVDFDPVTDNALAAGSPVPAELKEKAARRQQQKNTRPLPKDIKTLFPDSFTDSPLGPIPKGWKVSPIGEEVKVAGGGTPSTKKAEYWDDGINHFVTPKDLRDITGPVLLDTERKITDLGLSKVSSGLLPGGTVLLSSRAPIGYLAVAEIPVAVNQGFIAMVCEKELPNLYVLYWTMQNMETIKSRANGTTFMEVSKKNFRPIEIVVPSKVTLDAFMQKALPLYQDTVNHLKENKALTQLRDTLLPKLLTGEIEV